MWVLRVPPIIVFRNDINIIIIIIFPCWHYYCVAVWKWKEMSGILDNGEAVEMGQRYQISTFVLCYACWIQFHRAREWISFMRCWHSHRSGISPSPSGHMILDIEDSFFCWVLCDAAQHIPRAVELMPFTFCVSQVKRKDVTAECVAFAQFSDGVEVFSEAFIRNFPWLPPGIELKRRQ